MVQLLYSLFLSVISIAVVAANAFSHSSPEIDLGKRGGLAASVKRAFIDSSSSMFKRDGESASASLPDGFSTQLGYLSPNLSQVIAIAHHQSTAKDLFASYRETWMSACASALRQNSSDFAANKTFGWFTFQRDLTPSDLVNDGVIVSRAACYEASNYDPSGLNPGKAIAEHTRDLIVQLGWTKEISQKAGEQLEVQFESWLKSQNITLPGNTSNNGTKPPNTTSAIPATGSTDSKKGTGSSTGPTAQPPTN